MLNREIWTEMILMHKDENIEAHTHTLGLPLATLYRGTAALKKEKAYQLNNSLSHLD